MTKMRKKSQISWEDNHLQVTKNLAWYDLFLVIQHDPIDPVDNIAREIPFLFGDHIPQDN
jgi:hypothetical protein